MPLFWVLPPQPKTGELWLTVLDVGQGLAVVARTAHEDSLATRVARAIPATAYREAEAKVAADSSDWGAHAARFENVAMRWPEFEHADVAWYRAGLAYFRAGSTRDGARSRDARCVAARLRGRDDGRDARTRAR